MPTDRLAGLAGALEALQTSRTGAERAPLDDLARDLAAATGQAPVALTAGRDVPVSYTHLTLPTTPYV